MRTGRPLRVHFAGGGGERAGKVRDKLIPKGDREALVLYFIKKGVDLNHPNLTRDRRIWTQYLCWCIQSRLWGSVTWPMWLRVWVLKKFKKNIVYIPVLHPTKKRLERFFRSHTGDRSHRCEFTDPKRGALYGGKDAGFMNEYFEKFIENISGEL